ncbi:MAG: haloacid dehalogenase type II [Betaproteobacteria bacterium]|nr:haloacid dehalogenase type II [Betaproteobacteria bacterium]
MPRVIVFDVNETLLDLRALEPHFERLFGNPAVLREWFGQVLQSALLGVVIGPYSDFGKVGRSALAMVAARHGVTLADSDREAIVGGMRTLPAHPDVAPGLAKLRDAGFRLATLTNSPPQVAEAQIANAGLSEYFERIMSVDAVESLKPASKVYEYGARTLGVPIGDMRLVAAHSWDVAGAMRAGARAAFVTRPGMVLDPLWEAPDIVGADISEVADRIIACGG